MNMYYNSLLLRLFCCFNEVKIRFAFAIIKFLETQQKYIAKLEDEIEELKKKIKYDYYRTYIQIPIDSQFMFGQICGIFPDVYRGGKAGEVYVSSMFPGVSYKVSFSADTGHTFRHVYVSENLKPGDTFPTFMSDRKPGVFYIIHFYKIEDTDPWGWHTKICVEYYRDYGETLETIFCHDITKDYEYEEVTCEHTTRLNSKMVNPNSVQLQWSNSADSSCIRGYHVYRNHTRITNPLLTDTTCLDENLPDGDYEYYVRTYYKEGCISDASNHVQETIKLGVQKIDNIEEIILFLNPTTGELRISNIGHQASKFLMFCIEKY